MKKPLLCTGAAFSSLKSPLNHARLSPAPRFDTGLGLRDELLVIHEFQFFDNVIDFDSHSGARKSVCDGQQARNISGPPVGRIDRDFVDGGVAVLLVVVLVSFPCVKGCLSMASARSWSFCT